MDKDELISIAKPILFNTEMVRAILDERKTVTRRICKITIYNDAPASNNYCKKYCQICDYPKVYIGDVCAKFYTENHLLFTGAAKPYYQKGDILYVRETWKQAVTDPTGGGYALNDIYLYRADEPIDTTGMLIEEHWRPSIHMPKKAARIFLQVTDVRVEHLQDINADGIRAEGLSSVAVRAGDCAIAKKEFALLWNKTIKPKDYDLYGWNTNPWVWKIEFKRIKV